MEILLTVKELARALKVTDQTIQRYILRKDIPYRKIMRMVRFRPSEINRWIDEGGLEKCQKADCAANGELFAETAVEKLPVEEIGGEV